MEEYLGSGQDFTNLGQMSWDNSDYMESEELSMRLNSCGSEYDMYPSEVERLTEEQAIYHIFGENIDDQLDNLREELRDHGEDSTTMGRSESGYGSDECENSPSSPEDAARPTSPFSNSTQSQHINPQKRSRRMGICEHLFYQLKSGSSCVEWVDEECQIFKMVDQHQLAREWGIYSKGQPMKFADYGRILRYHYSKSKHTELRKPTSDHLVYQFTPTGMMKFYRFFASGPGSF